MPHSLHNFGLELPSSRRLQPPEAAASSELKLLLFVCFSFFLSCCSVAALRRRAAKKIRGSGPAGPEKIFGTFGPQKPFFPLTGPFLSRAQTLVEKFLHRDCGREKILDLLTQQQKF